jgi:hypothetical protein
MARSGPERMRMASSMFDSARRLILASLPQNLTPAEQRLRLRERLYGDELCRDEDCGPDGRPR